MRQGYFEYSKCLSEPDREDLESGRELIIL